MKVLVGIAFVASLLAASPTSAENVPPTTTTTTAPLVSAIDRAEWSRVAQCETHQRWDYEGARYDGGLGIERGNWVHYGGTEFAPAPHLATEDEQIFIAKRIESMNGHAGYVPDQDGKCRGW